MHPMYKDGRHGISGRQVQPRRGISAELVHPGSRALEDVDSSKATLKAASATASSMGDVDAAMPGSGPELAVTPWSNLAT